MKLVYYMTMIMANIHEVKANLSRYLAKVKQGEVVTICNRNVPVAELRPIAADTEPKPKRQLGYFKDQIQIHESFFEPLDDELLDLFEGKGTDF